MQSDLRRGPRLITKSRLDVGMWTVANPCQRTLIVLGGVVILGGCYLLSCNEEFFALRGQEVAHAEAGFVDVPCDGAGLLDEAAAKKANGSGLATTKSSLLHLEDCPVSQEDLSADTPGLSILYAFRHSLPSSSLKGAWLKVHLEQFSTADGEWWPISEFKNLRATEVFAHQVRIGGLRLSRELGAMVPGSVVPVVQSPTYKPPRPGHKVHALDDRNMRAHDAKLYSGNPGWPVDGDVRVWFTVGDTPRASVLAAWSGERLALWRSPSSRGDFDPLASPRELGIVAAGAVSARALLSKIAPFSEEDVWPMRGVGLLVVWIGMSLLLFPNYVVANFCGGCCFFRSLPGALFTTFVVAGVPAIYFRFRSPVLATVLAAALAALLLAVAFGGNLRSWRRKMLRRRNSRRSSRNRGDGLAALAAEQAGHPLLGSPPPSAGFGQSESSQGEGGAGGCCPLLQEPGGFSEKMRVVAIATVVGIMLAGPVVRALALVDLFGDYYDASRVFG